MDDRQARLEAALQAAVKAKNPWLAASLRAALRGEEYDPFKDFSTGHPEMDEELRRMWGDD